MHDPLPVRRLQRVRDLAGGQQRLRQGQRAPLQPAGERLALHVLHDQERPPVHLAHVVQRADVGMAQARHQLRLAAEALEVLGLLGVRAQHLERDRAVEAAVAGAVHLAHAARAQQAQDLVGSEPRAVGQGHWRVPRL